MNTHEHEFSLFPDHGGVPPRRRPTFSCSNQCYYRQVPKQYIPRASGNSRHPLQYEYLPTVEACQLLYGRVMLTFPRFLPMRRSIPHSHKSDLEQKGRCNTMCYKGIQRMLRYVVRRGVYLVRKLEKARIPTILRHKVLSACNSFFRTEAPLGPRWGDKPLKFHVLLSPKRDCGPERAKEPRQSEVFRPEKIHPYIPVARVSRSFGGGNVTFNYVICTIYYSK